MDIRKFWPEITNEEVDVLQSLSPYGWLIAKRLYKGGRIGGREISEDDLLQGFPKEKLGKARDAVITLEKKRIIVKKPKPTVVIYQARHDFFTNPSVIVFINKITESEMLRESLINESLEFKKVSETLVRIVNNTLDSKGNILEKKITASDKIAFDDNLGLKVNIKAQCPKGGSFELEYHVVGPADMSKFTFKPPCTCCSIHVCTAFGHVLSTY
ncbi:MAG: hypothetical protein FWF07_01185 [Methanomassiliicoccaceae archaeon]|nr:hypothetical protein [Methanomassiliicoccaceae archaeon]